MDPQELVKLLKAQPFEPFTIRLLDGRTYDVRHPEVLVVARRHVFLFLTKRDEHLYDDWAVLSLLGIASLHPLKAA